MNVNELFNKNNEEDVSLMDKKERERLLMEQRNKDAVHNAMLHDLQNRSVIDTKTANKYSEYGLTWSPKNYQSGALDAQLADAQSNWAKAGNAIRQTLVSEIGLGTLIAFSDLADILINAGMSGDNDYTNPITNKLVEWQETYRNERAPIYSKPGAGFGNGTDFGWWMQNIPSIASSLTLLIPSMAATKMMGLGAKLTTKTAKALRGSKAAKKWARATDAAEEATKANRFLLSADTVKKLEYGAQGISNAVISRTLENYQESRQVYEDMYGEVKDSIDKMTDDEYRQFVERNANTLAGVDINNKEAVAKKIAKESADTTFKMDYANIGFDILQMFALRNMTFRGFRNSKLDASARRLNKNANKYFGQYKSLDELKELVKKQSFRTKAANFAEDALYAGLTVGFAQATEGLEEAINYIASQEGMHVGHTMLGMVADGAFSNRIWQYAKAPELWESAFWGVAGGIAFQQGASLAGRANMAHNAKKQAKKNQQADESKTGENTESGTWREYWETPDTKRVKAAIQNRIATENNYRDIIKKINDGFNPFANDVPIKSQAERELLKQRALNYRRAQLALNAMDSGTMGILKAYLQDDNVKKAMVEQGVMSEEDATRFQAEDIRALEVLEEKYNFHAKNLKQLSRQLADDEGNQIPLDYLQIIARNNMEYELILDDYNTTKNATLSEASNYEDAIIENNPGFANDIPAYKTAIDLTWGITRLGELEAEKKQLKSKKVNKDNIFIIERLTEIDKQIALVRDKIYNAEENQKLPRLLFAIENSMAAFMDKDGSLNFDLSSKDYKNFIEIVSKQDKEALEKIDERLVDITDNDVKSSEILRGDYNLIMNPKSEGSLDKISGDLKQKYVTLAALDYHIKDVKSKMVITAEQMENEAYELHNVLNAVRRAKIANASNIILDLASKDKYGVEPIKKLLAQSYRGETLDFSGLNMKPNEEEQLKDAFDTINFGNRLNKSIYQNINAYLDKLPAIEAANEIQTAIESDTDTNDDDSNETSNPAQSLDDEAKKSQNSIEKIATKYDDTTNNLINFILANKNKGYIEYNKDDDTFGATVVDIADDGSITIQTYEGLSKQWIENKNLFTIDSNVDTNTDNYTTQTTIVISKDGEIIDKGRIVSSEVAVEHGNSSTGELTGSAVQPVSSIANKIEEQLAKEEEKEKAKEQAKVVSNANQREDKEPTAAELGYVPSDNAAIEESTQISSEALILVGQQIKNGKSIDELKDDNNEIRLAIIDELHKKHTNTTRDDIENKVNNAIGTLDRIPKSSLALSAGNLMFSSLELRDNKSDTVEAFRNAFNNFTKEIDVRVIDDKKYINVESLCRYIGHLLNEDSIAKIIADNVIKFVNNAENKIVILDEKPNEIKHNIINNPQKPVSKDMVTNINLSPILAENTEVIGPIVDNLNIGDKLKVKSIKGSGVRFYTVDNGKEITLGGLSALSADGRGIYYQYNDGWKTDIAFNSDGTIDSRLMTLFISWINNNDSDDSVKELNNIILKYAYNTANKETLVEDFEKNKAINKAKKAGYIVENPDYNKLLNGLAKIWKFVYAGRVYDGTKDVFKQSITEWFTTKVAPSFKLLNELQKSNNDTVEITNITEGQIVISSTLNPIKDAIGSAHKGKVRIGICETPGIIRLAGDGINGTRQLSYPGTKQGRTLLAIPARNGAHAYVNAYGMPISEMDSNSNNSANKIKNQIFTSIEQLLNSYANESIKNKTNIVDILYKFLKNTIPYKNTNNKIDFKSSYFVNNSNDVEIYVQRNFQRNYGNTPSGVTVTIRNGSDYTNININNTGKISVRVNKTDKTNEFPIKKIIELIESTITNHCKYNISFDFVRADNESTVSTGFAIRTTDGKFAFAIPTYKVEGTELKQAIDSSKVYKFDSYNSFLIDNNLIKVNTEVPIGESNNFNRFDNNFPQEITVKLSSSPVEEVSETTTATQQTETSTIETYLNNNKDNVDAKELTNLILENEYLENNPILENLLPKNLIFMNEYLGVNGVTNNTNEPQTYKIGDNEHTISANTVAIGLDFLKMATSNNPASKEEAIRKLFHEELHVKFKDSTDEDFEVIRSIFDKFEDSVNKLTDDNLKNILLDYTYPNKYRDDNGNITRKGLEEFVVECLTSKTLSGYLNTIEVNNQTETSGATNLLERLVEIFCKILGIDINKQSLYYESLKAISQLDKQEPTSINTTETENNQNNHEFDGLDFSELNDTYTPEMQAIKDEAIANSTFMKAPNGKPSNLNERQWIHVRTKAFKDWFGDWEENSILLDKIKQDDWTFVFEDINSNKLKVGSKVNLDNRLDNLCIYTRNKAIAHLNKLGFKYVYAAGGLRAKSPVMDITIGHHAPIVNIGGVLYLYDMPQTEFISTTNKTFGDDNQYKEGIVTSNFKPRFIELTVDNLVNVYGNSKEYSEWYVEDQYENGYKDNLNNASKVVDENGEPLVVYHGSDSYGFDIFDPKMSDDKRSLFFSGSKFIASTYTKFEPLRNEVIRERLIKNNAIELIKNKDYDALKTLIEEILAYNLHIPRDENKIYDNRYSGYIDEMIYKLRKELLNSNLNENEIYAIQAEMSKLEDLMWFGNNYRLDITSYKVNGKEKIKLTIIDNNEAEFSGIFKQEGIIFNGTPEELIESIYTKTKIYDIFLNIKNPLVLDNQIGEFGANHNWNSIEYKGRVYKTRDIAKIALEDGYDGVVFKDIVDHGPYSGDSSLDPTTDRDIANAYFHEFEDSYTGANIYAADIFIAFDSNQVKSATDNIGSYSTENNNIYFSEITESSNTYASIDSYLNRFHGETYKKVKDMIDSGEIEIKCKLN